VVSTVEDVARLQVSNPERVAYVTQTTLSIDDTRDVIAALKRRFPSIQGPGLDDICYATQNRQNAVSVLAKQVDLLLVVGARNSSNSNRLREVGAQCGVPAYLIENECDLDPDWLKAVSRVGVTAGASAPEILVQRVIEKLRQFNFTGLTEHEGVRECTSFRLPRIPVPDPADAPVRDRFSQGD